MPRTGHVDPHPRDRLGGREPRLPLGLLGDRLLDPSPRSPGRCSSRATRLAVRPRIRHERGSWTAHPVQLVVEDDLKRSRLTVFFRLLLAIPHLIWVFLWTIATFFVAIVTWFVDADHGAAAGRRCTVSFALRPLLGAPQRVSHARRQPVPGRSSARRAGTRSTSGCPSRRRRRAGRRCCGSSSRCRRCSSPPRSSAGPARRRLARGSGGGASSVGRRAGSRRRSRSSAGSRASRRAGCRRGCATRARTASATGRRRSRTCCSSPTATRTRIRRRCSTASSRRREHPVRLVGDADDLRRLAADRRSSGSCSRSRTSSGSCSGRSPCSSR